MLDAGAEEFYPFIIRNLNERNLAYLHIGFEEAPTTEINWRRKLRPLYRGVYFANGGFTRETGEKPLAGAGADAIVYGKLFLANPYTDYPTLERASAA